MPRIYLLSIILAVFLVLIFGDDQFLLDPKEITILGREISLNSQIIISSLAVLILAILLCLGFIEKIVVLFKSNSKTEKKKEMAVKK